MNLTHGGALSNLSLFVAIDLDLFSDLGLDVAAPALTGFGSTVSRLRDGSAALGTTGFTQALADADDADPLLIVAGSGLRGMALLGHPGQTLPSLSGTTVGTFMDDPMQVLLMDILLQHGLLSRVEQRAMSSLNAAADAFRRGEVAAFMTVEPWISRLRREGAVVLSDGTDVWGPVYPDTVLVAPRSRVEQHPETVTAVIRAMLRAERLIAEDPCGALATTAHRFPGFSLAELAAGLAGQPPRIDLRGVEATIFDRWETVRRLQGKPDRAPPTGLIEFRCLAAAVAAEALRGSVSSAPERMLHDA